MLTPLLVQLHQAIDQSPAFGLSCNSRVSEWADRSQPPELSLRKRDVCAGAKELGAAQAGMSCNWALPELYMCGEKAYHMK